MFILKWYSVMILSIILIGSLDQDIETDEFKTIGLTFIPILIYVLLT